MNLRIAAGVVLLATVAAPVVAKAKSTEEVQKCVLAKETEWKAPKLFTSIKFRVDCAQATCYGPDFKYPLGHCESDEKSVQAAHTADPGNEIVGAVAIAVTSSSDGGNGPYQVLADSSGLFTKVAVPLWCKSKAIPAGPGAWHEVQLSGTQSRAANKDQYILWTIDCAK